MRDFQSEHYNQLDFSKKWLQSNDRWKNQTHDNKLNDFTYFSAQQSSLVFSVQL